MCAFLGICCMSDKLLCADYCVSWCVSVCLDAHTRPRWSERYSRCWGWGRQGRRRTTVHWSSRSTWRDTTKPASTPTSLSDRPIDATSRIPVGRQVPPRRRRGHTRVHDGPAADLMRADVHTDVDIAVEAVRCISAGAARRPWGRAGAELSVHVHVNECHHVCSIPSSPCKHPPSASLTNGDSLLSPCCIHLNYVTSTPSCKAQAARIHI